MFSFSGHGNIAPRTTLGRIVTLAYAVLGIPLTLVYLSSTGGVLARVARGVFSKWVNYLLQSSCYSVTVELFVLISVSIVNLLVEIMVK